MGGFYTALEAREASTRRREVFDEIALIERTIMDEIDVDGVLEVLVGPSGKVPTTSGFTVSATHYNAWADSISNTANEYVVARKQMDDVIGHFARLNYVVTRERYRTSTTFSWRIKW